MRSTHTGRNQESHSGTEKKHWATGVDDVTLEALKAAAQAPEVFKALHKAVCNIWNTGVAKVATLDDKVGVYCFPQKAR